MASLPKTQYAKSGELHIAYQVTGQGPLDLVLVPGFVSHLECQWEHPWSARLVERLGAFLRLIRFDKRGTGLSDRVGGIPTLEQRMDDVRYGAYARRAWAPDHPYGQTEEEWRAMIAAIESSWGEGAGIDVRAPERGATPATSNGAPGISVSPPAPARRWP